MSAANLGAASQQTAWMLQKVNSDVQISENLDRAGDSLFGNAPTEEIGLQQYRHPIEVEVGGIGGYYQPDGGSYFQGQANQVDQMIVAPLPIMVAISATELARRIAKGGRDVTVDNWIARMISKVKDKAAHLRNGYLNSSYNTGVLATVDASYSSGNTIQLAKTPNGGRLLDRNGYYQITDASFNVIGNVNVLALSKNGVGTIDTATVDAAPGGTAANYNFLPIGLSTGNPIGINSFGYIISSQTTLEYCGISRANEYVQSPTYNANGAYLTLGMVSAFMTRMAQALGEERFKQRKGNFWYGHRAQIVSADILGFSKTLVTTSDGKIPTFDPAVDPFVERTIAGKPVVLDSMADVTQLRWIDKGTMKRVRYPGSQAFIPGMVEGIFWPRQSGGLWVAESDAMYQDSVNYYSNLPWANGAIFNLGVQSILSN